MYLNGGEVSIKLILCDRTTRMGVNPAICDAFNSIVFQNLKFLYQVEISFTCQIVGKKYNAVIARIRCF